MANIPIEENMILEWKKTDILSKDLAEFKKNVCELACNTLVPKEVKFLQVFPQAVTQEMFLRPCAPLFDKGIENVDWAKVSDTIHSTMKQFYLADISTFGESLLKPLMQDVYYLVSIKEKEELLGFAMFAVTPALPSGHVKLINLAVLPKVKELDKLLMNSIFKILPESKTVFLYTRPTNTEDIQSYLSWGFKKDASPVNDPNHKVNNDYLLYLEYTISERRGS
ncbi:MAG TPA: hypothetical protein VLG44_01915 [Chlamydiales bacterium]|nr:hypothetical protein [Chlamydiales bacterium]